ncbi:hypothetical protein ACFFX0_31050 [Citricoccus parietis]|uniref:Uncharacterized protein n=1 Tax=Citricoccus parietis TaxID=592307 RepID=A0ABV5G8V6_9MICC
MVSAAGRRPYPPDAGFEFDNGPDSSPSSTFESARAPFRLMPAEPPSI